MTFTNKADTKLVFLKNQPLNIIIHNENKLKKMSVRICH